MKTVLGIPLLFVITTISYSQNMTQDASNEGSVNKKTSSEFAINHTDKEMSIYSRDVNVDSKVAKLEKAFIDYDLGKNAEGYDSSLVSLELEKGNARLQATYNANGKLTSVVESYKNVVLPISVCRSVYKEYPGWQIVKDKYKIVQENGGIVTKEYRLTMKKDNKTQKVIVNQSGAILASR